jgi:4-hydroxy 2-oxovalerate aldolase
MKIKLLDCTLRDGGYVNDWYFGNDVIQYIFERLTESQVDIIEIGFIDDKRPFDKNYSIYPDTASINQVFSGLDKKNSFVVAMIDFGTCDIKQIQPAKDSFLDGIRVIFKKEKMIPAFQYIHQLIQLGYKVFAQAVSITSYNNEELLDFISHANRIKPNFVSIVDTYGLLHPSELFRLAKVMDQNLLPEISLGFHGHNNFQMAYANSISFLDLKFNRGILVDGTLYGLGKSAGNAPIELLGMYLNENYNKNYKIDQFLDAIQTNILDIFKNYPWGYSFFYYLAASNKCHPNYVSFLTTKRTLSISSINQILQEIEKPKKLNFDQKYIESLYLKHLHNEFDDNKELQFIQSIFDERLILVIGPGSSVLSESYKIHEFISKHNPIVFSINYIPTSFSVDYVFLTNSQRYSQLKVKLKSNHNNKISFIVTSNINFIENIPYIKLNFSTLIDESSEFPDNSLHMILRLFIALKQKKVYLSGFDGYTPDSLNYFDRTMQYSFVKDKADKLNNLGIEFLGKASSQIDITFITNSLYKR